MRAAMANAEVGDDVLGDDPAVRRLEEAAAARLGKEAAVFVPSGTMGNLIALLAHSKPGQAVLLDEDSHIYRIEGTGLARVAGLVPLFFRSQDGVPDPDDIARRVRPSALPGPGPAVLCLENTHNLAGGVAVPPERLRAAAEQARAAGLAVHLDGARLFNAAVALGVDARELAAAADSVMISLSKGLSAPVGSVLAGSRQFIARARRARYMLGGGMRQAGVLAAAGLVALETMVDRLADDHQVAAAIARAVAELEGVRLRPERVQTNIVLFSLPAGHDGPEFIRRLRARGVLAVATGPAQVRFVTHRHVTLQDVPRVAAAVRESLGTPR
ncbi:MAG: aminotransferase class I/II-fold pyridoxal phosphate-dependent enzyme [Firmicutes bacterium]|nr:aminotransferase class I/II-fold pyridoxal phosphate-dependent enzyme [Bacillota bacterium]